MTIGAAPRKNFRQELRRLRDEVWAALEAMPAPGELPAEQELFMWAARRRIARAIGTADAVLGDKS